jgi:hypothetical protein
MALADLSVIVRDPDAAPFCASDGEFPAGAQAHAAHLVEDRLGSCALRIEDSLGGRRWHNPGSRHTRRLD